MNSYVSQQLVPRQRLEPAMFRDQSTSLSVVVLSLSVSHGLNQRPSSGSRATSGPRPLITRPGKLFDFVLVATSPCISFAPMDLKKYNY